MKRITLIILAILIVITGLVLIGVRMSVAGQSSTSSMVQQSTAIQPEPEWDFETRVQRIRVEEAIFSKVSLTQLSNTELDDSLVDAIIRLQPTYAEKRHQARRLAEIIVEPAAEYGVNPFIALAVAMKESSLLPNQRGALGEESFFQVMPQGYARRVCSGGCESSSARCNARTAICFLDHVRTHCNTGDDPTLYVLAYGMSTCPTNRVLAAKSRPVRRGRGFLVDAVGEEQADIIWPM